MVRRAGAGGEVMSGCREGWFGFVEGEDTGEGDVGGRLVSSEGDNVVAIAQLGCAV